MTFTISEILNTLSISLPVLLSIVAGLVFVVVATIVTIVVKSKRAKKMQETFDWQVASVAKEEIIEQEEDEEEIALILGEAEDDEEDESSDKVAFKRSYFSKLVQADEQIKMEYNHFKNHALAFGKSRAHLSWYYESFYVNKVQYARLIFRGKTLCLCIALDPKSVQDQFKVVDMSNASRYKEVPTLLRLKNPKNFRDAIRLVDFYMSKEKIEQGNVESNDYVPEYMTDQELLEKKYIRPLEITQGTSTASVEKDEIDEVDLSDFEEDEVEILVDDDGNVEEIKFKRSFQSRIIQSNDVCKVRYNAIKNAFLSNPAISCQGDWSYEIFYFGDKEIGKINVKNNRLYVSLPLPIPQREVKYPYVDNSDKKAYKNTPLTLVVKTNKTARNTTKMVRAIVVENGLVSHLHKYRKDYRLPYQSSLELEKQGLVKFTDKDQEELYRKKWDKDVLENKIFSDHQNYFETIQNDFAVDLSKIAIDEVKYRRSVTAKLVQSDFQTKEYYRTLAEKLLSIKGVKMRTSWSYVKFSLHGQAIAYLTIKGKKLKLFLSLRPASFDKKVYHHTNAPKARRFETTPMAVTASGKRAFVRAQKLIDVMVEKNDYAWGKPKTLPVESLFYQTDSQLKESGLIKEVQTTPPVLARKIPTVEEIYGPDVYLRKSFYARLVQSRTEVKKAYVQLVEHMCSFKRIKYKTLWGSEAWTYKKTLLAKAIFKNERLQVFFNIQPGDKAIKKLRTENRSRYASCQKTPIMVRLDRLEDVENAKAVASVAFAELKQGEVTPQTRSLKKVGTLQLIEQGHVKVAKLPKFLRDKK